MKKLQVKIENEWKFVFCYNETKANPITTKDKRKALRAGAIDYFSSRFSNMEFRTV